MVLFQFIDMVKIGLVGYWNPDHSNFLDEKNLTGFGLHLHVAWKILMEIKF